MNSQRFQFQSQIICVVLIQICLSVSVFAVERPNVVVLLADDLGFKDIGCYDGPVKTPAIDDLAANGVRFTDFYSGANVCSPSRATLLTGRQHMRTGVYSWIADYDQASHLLESEITLAEILKQNGYSTGHFGKWHLGLSHGKRKKPTPADHGFDYWFATANNANPSHKNPTNFIRNGNPVGEIKGYACQIVVEEAISWLDKHPKSKKPFFLNIWFNEPHAPIAAPDEIVLPYGKLNDFAAIYSGTIDNTDRAVARLIAKLKQIGELQNTLIVYSSDNGSYRADRVGNLRGKKGSNYEGGIRVPGIFYWPAGIKKAYTESEPAGLVDVLPTVCGLLGLDKPAAVHLDGSDLTPLLTVAAPSKFKRHQPLFWHKPNSNPAIAMRVGDFSLMAMRDGEMPKDRKRMKELLAQIEAILKVENNPVLNGGRFETRIFDRVLKNRAAEKLRGQYVMLNKFNESWIPAIKSGTFSRFQLYDLATDPGQQTEISRQHPEVVERLKKQMLEINRSVMSDAPDWHLHESNLIDQASKASSIEEKTKVHRLDSKNRSPFDAFVYVNRIPNNADEGETVEDFTGRIFSRLANQEGRVLIKLPPGMDRQAYLGFKTFIRQHGQTSVGNCAGCHLPPEFTDSKAHFATSGGDAIRTPSLRNLAKSKSDLRKSILQHVEAQQLDPAFATIDLTANDVTDLVAFLCLLNDVSDEEFRELILNAKVLDTSKDIE